MKRSLRNLFLKQSEPVKSTNTFYSKNHSWLKINQNGNTATLGITEFAQSTFGNISKISENTENVCYNQGDELLMVRSNDGCWNDILMPISAEIIKLNNDIRIVPLILNRAPESDGWIADIKIVNKEELNNLMNFDEYKKFCKQI